MHGLIEGRSIHYVNEEGAHCAAIVVEIKNTAAPTINAFVPQRRQTEEGFVAEDVKYAPPTKNEPHTWHWIERVE